MSRRGTSLTRRTGRRTPKRTILIHCEGNITEVQYFDSLRKIPEVAKVAAIRIGVKGYSAMRLIDEAILADKKRTPDDSIDEVWCVFDVESPQPTPGISECIRKAEEAKIHLAISHPCFELWLSLHFVDHCAYLTTDAAVKLRAKHDSSKTKHLDFTKYKDQIGEAVERAAKLEQMRVSNSKSIPDNNPSSGVYRLVKSVMPQ